MNGTIKMYNSQKGYGFISSISGDIFFHISSVANREIIPEIGMNATFEIREGQKGKEAFNIRLLVDNRPKFIILGNERIKLSNIMDYGIADDKHNAIDSINAKMEAIKRCQYDIKRSQNKIDEIRENSYRSYADIFLPMKMRELNINDIEEFYEQEISNLKQTINDLNNEIKSIPNTNYTYLYIKTYQKNNYRYFQREVDFDIHEKLKELDEYFT